MNRIIDKEVFDIVVRYLAGQSYYEGFQILSQLGRLSIEGGIKNRNNSTKKKSA